MKNHVGRGVIVVLSDFLTHGDLKRPFNLLFSHGLELFAVQILGPTEYDPEVAGDLRFVDCETRATLDVSSTAELISLYHEYRTAYERNLALLCRQRSGRFLSISASEDLSYVLFDLLLRRGWIR